MIVDIFQDLSMKSYVVDIMWITSERQFVKINIGICE